ncbi:MAG TPA: LamG domain-containing protein [Bryobacteraceae bacterium]|nr:LamG domain-containing protein [Bryobacteraceae bacterium]
MRTLALFLVSLPAFGAYQYKGAVTFPAASGSTQTNITLAFTFSDTKFRTVANGGAIQNTVTRVGVTVPADFIFTDDSTCASATGSYTWGFERYSATAGTGTGWVMIPSHSSSAPKVPTVCLGNAAVSTYQGGAVGAEFDANTLGRWHMPDGASLSVSDFGANALITTNHGGTAVTGKVDGGLAIASASSQWVDVASNAGMNSTSFSVSGWFKSSTNGVKQDILRRDDGSFARSFMLRIGTTNQLQGFMIYGVNPSVTSAASVTDGNWHQAAMTVSYSAPNSTMTLYLDGTSVGSVAQSGTITSITQPLDIGRFSSGPAETFNGPLDELGFDTTARSANWIATEYANQNSPPAVSALSPLSPAATGSNTIVF